MAIKNILFDWDGCIVNTLPVWLSSYKELFNELSLFPTDEQIVDKVFGERFGPLNLGLPKTELVEFYKKLEVKITKGLLSDDVISSNKKEVLKKLKTLGLNLCIVTSSQKKYILPLLKKHNLENLFEFTLDINDVKKHKPNPEIVNLALDKFKAVPESSLIVGDSVKDIKAGRAANIKTCLYYPVGHKKFYPEYVLIKPKPDFVIEEFSELLAILL